MLYVALAEAAIIAVVVATFAGQIRALIRQHGRERDLILNQLLNLAGKPWTPPPADTWQPPTEPDDFGRYVTTPEQLPEESWDEQ